MRNRGICAGAVLAALLSAIAAPAGERPAVGSTLLRPSVPLDGQAMNAMLRADRDKDGTLSREELEHYDRGLARRFKEFDNDRDGKLTLYEFEKLLPVPELSASNR